MHDHIRNCLTLSGCATSASKQYAFWCYDKKTNLTANHEDTRIILNRGLNVNDNLEVGVRCKDDRALFESVDSKKMVKNLCASQKYYKMDLFLTFTGNLNPWRHLH